MASEGFHESSAELSAATRDLHRAIVSLMEELEAIDWYQQRIDVTADAELKQILAHNRDEEKEHAAMLIEWLRRRDAAFDERLRMFLYRDGPLTALEAPERENGTERAAAPVSGLIGSLRGVS